MRRINQSIFQVVIITIYFVSFNHVYSQNPTVNFGSEICTDLNIFPSANSFDPQDLGKLLISTKQDNSYYTDYQIDNNGEGLDGKVRVRVYVPMEFKNSLIYFNVIDPDDQSMYESDLLGDDNFDSIEKYKPAFDKADQVGTFNGQNYAYAETYVTLSKYSGDNIIVQASPMRGNFNNEYVVETPVLTSWKRLYIEKDNMLDVGSCLSRYFREDQDNNQNFDRLYVYNHDDFNNNDIVTFFEPNGNTYTKQVLGKGSSNNFGPFIDVENFSANTVLHRFTGVVKNNSNEYDVETELLEEGFGDKEVNGNKDGCFVEFGSITEDQNNSYDGVVPNLEENWKATDISTREIYVDFAQHWSKYSNDGDNVVHLVASGEVNVEQPDGSISSGPLGYTTKYDLTIPSSKRSSQIFIFTSNASSNAMANETLVHEMGHIFNVSNSHVDKLVAVESHLKGGDICVMSYSRNRTDSVAEFDYDLNNSCIKQIRRANDPR